VRDAFLLSQLDGMGQADIAARLGISLATVKRHIARAMLQCCFAD
jgi:RNA polymerase sigma-70 factor (ECF subfamily)